MLTSSGGGGGRSMLTVADRGEGVKFAKILLLSYVNAPLQICSLEFFCLFKICPVTIRNAEKL